MKNATLALVSVACFLLPGHKNSSDLYLQLSGLRLSLPTLGIESTLKSQAIVTLVGVRGDSLLFYCFCHR